MASKFHLPGVKEEEVKVEVEEGNVLKISGERSREKEEKNDKWHHVERSSGEFLRRFRLPNNAKVDQVKAVMENGVLTVTVPKEKVKKPAAKAPAAKAPVKKPAAPAPKPATVKPIAPVPAPAPPTVPQSTYSGPLSKYVASYRTVPSC